MKKFVKSTGKSGKSEKDTKITGKKPSTSPKVTLGKYENMGRKGRA